MRNEGMVGSRLPKELLRDLEMIERLEQTDRSTTVRKLLAKAVYDWKRDHFARQYGEGKMTLAKAASRAGVSLWEMMEFVRANRIAAQYDLNEFSKDVRKISG